MITPIIIYIKENIIFFISITYCISQILIFFFIYIWIKKKKNPIRNLKRLYDISNAGNESLSYFKSYVRATNLHYEIMKYIANIDVFGSVDYNNMTILNKIVINRINNSYTFVFNIPTGNYVEQIHQLSLAYFLVKDYFNIADNLVVLDEETIVYSEIVKAMAKTGTMALINPLHYYTHLDREIQKELIAEFIIALEYYNMKTMFSSSERVFFFDDLKEYALFMKKYLVKTDSKERISLYINTLNKHNEALDSYINFKTPKNMVVNTHYSKYMTIIESNECKKKQI